jgi:hypothetical protein
MQGPLVLLMRTPPITCPALAVIGPDEAKLVTRGPALPLPGLNLTVEDEPVSTVPVELPPPVSALPPPDAETAPVVLATQQVLSRPTAGSPNVMLLHTTPFVACVLVYFSVVP